MSDEEREQRFFDRREAELLLPTLKDLLVAALEKKKLVEAVEQEFSQVQNRILLVGGILPPYGYLAEKRVERDKLVAGIRLAVEQIEESGCVVKDLESGLLDFPSIVNDEEVFLCWKLGEESIEWYHGLEEGFAGRKRLDASASAPDAESKPN
ncbi:MAG: DUF2203 domain-containing protein [Terriglobia bacterium]